MFKSARIINQAINIKITQGVTAEGVMVINVYNDCPDNATRIVTGAAIDINFPEKENAKEVELNE